MSDPRGATAAQAASVSSKSKKAGQLFITDTLDASALVAKVVFSGVASRMSYQTTGDLVCTVTTSLNGTNTVALAGASPTAIVTEAAHNTTSVTFTRTGGAGKVIVAVTGA